MGLYNIKEKIVEHYDFTTPYYRSLWGEHVHHGYWTTGKESKEKAQVALIDHLAKAARIKKGSQVLDVGCGIGGTSLHLAKHYGVKPTGITISPVQVAMAKAAAERERSDAQFLLMDAQKMAFEHSFDHVISIESISHYQDKLAFFKRAAEYLKPGGTLALIDWFKKEDLTPAQYKKYIIPIEHGMFVELHVMEEYIKFLELQGLKVCKIEDISPYTAKTWDICLDIIKNKALWKLAMKTGKDFVHFLRAFQAMRAGYKTKNFVYGMIIAEKSK